MSDISNILKEVRELKEKLQTLDEKVTVLEGQVQAQPKETFIPEDSVHGLCYGKPVRFD